MVHATCLLPASTDFAPACLLTSAPFSALFWPLQPLDLALLLIYQSCNLFVPPPRQLVPSHSPCFPTDLDSFFNQTFLEILPHLFDTRRFLHHQCCPGLHPLFENTCSYIISQLPNLASFQFPSYAYTALPSDPHTNDQFVIWSTLLLPNHLNISNQFSFTFSDQNVFNHSPAFPRNLICDQ